MWPQRRTRNRAAALFCKEEGSKCFNSQLVRLIRQQDYQAHIILQHCNPRNYVDSWGATLLHIAAECGNDSVVQYLVDLGCDVDAQDDLGITPLLLAVIRQHDMSIKVLLEAKASIDIPDALGRNAFELTLATYSVLSVATKMFLRRVKLDCANDSVAIAKRLLQANCPLCRAIHLGDLDVLKIMIERGSDVNLRCYEIGLTALHVAVDLNDVGAVKLLVEHGADLKAEDSFGRPALFYSYIEREHSDRKLEIIRILINHGISYKMSSYTTVLKFGDQAVVRSVLQSNINMFDQDDIHGNSPLHYLAENYNPGVIEELDGKSYDIHALDKYGNSALLVAASSGTSKTVEYLLERGANPNVAHQRFGYTALYNAFINSSPTTQREYKRIIEILLKHGADPQMKIRSPNDLNTVFDVAVRKCMFTLAEPVLAHLALLEAQGTNIDEFVVERIESHPRLSNYFRMCKRRLERIKKVKVYGYVTLFKILTESHEKISRYARNRELIAKLKISSYKSNSPSSYCAPLRERVAKAVRVAEDREKATVVVGQLLGLKGCDSSVIVDKIVSFLNDQDVQNLRG